MYTVIWLATIGLIAFSVWRKRKAYRAAVAKRGLTSYVSTPDYFIEGLVGSIVLTGLLMASIAATAIAIDNNVSAGNQRFVIAEKVQQRDELAALIRDELSAEKYTELMAAIPDDIPNMRVWIGSGASDVLTERAGRIVTLNEQLYAMEMNVIERRTQTCNMVQNPLVPRLPFGYMMPDCELSDEVAS